MYSSKYLFILLFSLITAPSAMAEDAQVLSPSELGAVSAGEVPHVTVATRQSVDAVSSNNRITAGTVTSGDVSFSADALSGFSGVGNIVVNTGNNNSIQGTLSVTVMAMPK